MIVSRKPLEKLTTIVRKYTLAGVPPENGNVFDPVPLEPQQQEEMNVYSGESIFDDDIFGSGYERAQGTVATFDINDFLPVSTDNEFTFEIGNMLGDNPGYNPKIDPPGPGIPDGPVDAHEPMELPAIVEVPDLQYAPAMLPEINQGGSPIFQDLLFYENTGDVDIYDTSDLFPVQEYVPVIESTIRSLQAARVNEFKVEIEEEEEEELDYGALDEEEEESPANAQDATPANIPPFVDFFSIYKKEAEKLGAKLVYPNEIAERGEINDNIASFGKRFIPVKLKTRRAILEAWGRADKQQFTFSEQLALLYYVIERLYKLADDKSIPFNLLHGGTCSETRDLPMIFDSVQSAFSFFNNPKSGTIAKMVNMVSFLYSICVDAISTKVDLSYETYLHGKCAKRNGLHFRKQAYVSFPFIALTPGNIVQKCKNIFSAYAGVSLFVPRVHAKIHLFFNFMSRVGANLSFPASNFSEWAQRVDEHLPVVAVREGNMPENRIINVRSFAFALFSLGLRIWLTEEKSEEALDGFYNDSFSFLWMYKSYKRKENVHQRLESVQGVKEVFDHVSEKYQLGDATVNHFGIAYALETELRKQTGQNVTGKIDFESVFDLAGKFYTPFNAIRVWVLMGETIHIQQARASSVGMRLTNIIKSPVSGEERALGVDTDPVYAFGTSQVLENYKSLVHWIPNYEYIPEFHRDKPVVLLSPEENSGQVESRFAEFLRRIEESALKKTDEKKELMEQLRRRYFSAARAFAGTGKHDSTSSYKTTADYLNYLEDNPKELETILKDARARIAQNAESKLFPPSVSQFYVPARENKAADNSISPVHATLGMRTDRRHTGLISALYVWEYLVSFFVMPTHQKYAVYDYSNYAYNRDTKPLFISCATVSDPVTALVADIAAHMSAATYPYRDPRKGATNIHVDISPLKPFLYTPLQPSLSVEVFLNEDRKTAQHVDGQILWLPADISKEQLRNLVYRANVNGKTLESENEVYELQSAFVTDDGNNVYKVLSSLRGEEEEEKKEIVDPNFESLPDAKLAVSKCIIRITSKESSFDQPLSKLTDFIYRSIVPRVRTFTMEGNKVNVSISDAPIPIKTLKVNEQHVAGNSGFLSVLFTGEGIDQFVNGRLSMLNCKKSDVVPGRLTELLQKTAKFDMDLDMSPGEQIVFGKRQHELLFYRFMAWYTCELHADRQIVLPYTPVMKAKLLADNVQPIVLISREIAYRDREQARTVDDIYNWKIIVKGMEYKSLFLKS